MAEMEETEEDKEREILAVRDIRNRTRPLSACTFLKYLLGLNE